MVKLTFQVRNKYPSDKEKIHFEYLVSGDDREFPTFDHALEVAIEIARETYQNLEVDTKLLTNLEEIVLQYYK